MSPILGASDAWPTNAALIARAVRPMGYIPDEALVVDVTYGKGRWWAEYRPSRLVAHDLDRSKGDGVDFRHLPEATGTVDVVAYDPSYVTPGGRRTSTVKDFQNDYGMDSTPTTLTGTFDLIVAGLTEIRRVLRPRTGLVLMKSMNYVNGGRYRPVAYDLYAAAVGLGYELIDEFVHITGLKMQPGCRTCNGTKKVTPPGCVIPEECPTCAGTGDVEQQHARRNYSLLFVLRRDSEPWEDPAAQLFAHGRPVCVEERDCPGRPPCPLCKVQ